MAEPTDDDRAIDRWLAGWGTPEPRAGFAERVCARVEVEAAARIGTRRRWALSFALGGMVGGLVVAAVIGSSLRPEPPPAPSSARRIHLQAPGVADVVGEPGSQLYWQRRDDGRVVLELREGIAWVRRTAGGAELTVIAGGDESVLRGACVRLEVVRGLLSVDASIDDVECARVDELVEQVRAELSDAGPR